MKKAKSLAMKRINKTIDQMIKEPYCLDLFDFNTVSELHKDDQKITEKITKNIEKNIENINSLYEVAYFTENDFAKMRLVQDADVLTIDLQLEIEVLNSLLDHGLDAVREA